MVCDQVLPHLRVRGVSVPPRRRLEGTGCSTGAQGTGLKVSLVAGTCESRVEAVELSGRHQNSIQSLCPSRHRVSRSHPLHGSPTVSGLGGLTIRSYPTLYGEGSEKGTVKRKEIRLGAVALCPHGVTPWTSKSLNRIQGDRRAPVLIVRHVHEHENMVPWFQNVHVQ